MTRLRAARGSACAVVVIAAAALAAGAASAQPTGQPPPDPVPAATAAASAAEPAPQPEAMAVSPDSMPTSTAAAPLATAPSPDGNGPPVYLSPARDRRGNPLEGRPAYLPWAPGEVIPPGYEPWSSPAKRLLISGLTVGGSTYLGSFIAAYVAAIKGDADQWGALFAPVVGPFVAVETAHASDLGAYMLILDGLAQTTGMALFIAAFATSDHGLKRQRDRLQPKVSGAFAPGGASLKVEF